MDRGSLKQILLKIYNEINDIETIYNNKSISIYLNEHRKIGGYSYIEKYNCTVKSLCSNNCIREIVNQCIKSNIKLIMKITLVNNTQLVISLNNDE